MTWDHGGSNSYRMGAEGKYDLRLSMMSESDANSIGISTSKSIASSTGLCFHRRNRILKFEKFC